MYTRVCEAARLRERAAERTARGQAHAPTDRRRCPARVHCRTRRSAAHTDSPVVAPSSRALPRRSPTLPYPFFPPAAAAGYHGPRAVLPRPTARAARRAAGCDLLPARARRHVDLPRGRRSCLLLRVPHRQARGAGLRRALHEGGGGGRGREAEDTVVALRALWRRQQQLRRPRFKPQRVGLSRSLRASTQTAWVGRAVAGSVWPSFHS